MEVKTGTADLSGLAEAPRRWQWVPGENSHSPRPPWERKACFDQCRALSASGYTMIQTATAAERRAR